jgi:hypothetical protein
VRAGGLQSEDRRKPGNQNASLQYAGKRELGGLNQVSVFAVDVSLSVEELK